MGLGDGTWLFLSGLIWGDDNSSIQPPTTAHQVLLTKVPPRELARRSFSSCRQIPTKYQLPFLEWKLQKLCFTLLAVGEYSVSKKDTILQDLYGKLLQNSRCWLRRISESGLRPRRKLSFALPWTMGRVELMSIPWLGTPKKRIPWTAREFDLSLSSPSAIWISACTKLISP